MSNLSIQESLPLSKLKPDYKPEISGYLPRQVVRRNPDILFSLPLLYSRYPDLDLNEPASRQFFLNYLENGSYSSMITLSRERYFQLQIDNDIFNYTDRYYTNGISLRLISPILSQNPLSKLLIPYWGEGINYYSISLVQDMYTPSTTKIDGILDDDRPYAAYLYIGSGKITNDILRKIRLYSEIQVGIIGPASFGEFVQRSFHKAVPTNNEPLGWEYQIQNDLLLNYYARIEKGIVSIRGLDMLIHGSGTVGTVFTNISGGIYLRTGWFNSYFMNLFFSKRSLNKIRHARNVQFYFFTDISGKAVGYDATLHGGLFNRTSPYTIPGNNISRITLIGSAGIVFSYGGVQLKGEQYLLSPEFVNGWWHKWLSIGLSFSF
ncbi:MAG: lipid A deacylase LpxR family protein [Bacteroidales bacterium]|nr:lipid A deacylase LpxR family protein [Bacteroidales bacterium]